MDKTEFAQSLIGLPLEDAYGLIKASGLERRLVADYKDGKRRAFITTRDYRPDRANIEVDEQNRVIVVRWG